MPHKDQTAAKQYHRQYQAKNREKLSANSKAYYEANKEKLLAQQKAYRQTHKVQKAARSRAYYMKNKPIVLAKSRDYVAINKARTQARQASQGARNSFERAIQIGRPKPDACEACGGNRGGIVFDHCHERGHPRGWLCWTCNVALGHLGDDPNRLRKLIAYLDRTRENTSPQLSLSGI
jgi:hypothetical protein